MEMSHKPRNRSAYQRENPALAHHLLAMLNKGRCRALLFKIEKLTGNDSRAAVSVNQMPQREALVRDSQERNE